jgi:hypothetical protein
MISQRARSWLLVCCLFSLVQGGCAASDAEPGAAPDGRKIYGVIDGDEVAIKAFISKFKADGCTTKGPTPINEHTQEVSFECDSARKADKMTAEALVAVGTAVAAASVGEFKLELNVLKVSAPCPCYSCPGGGVGIKYYPCYVLCKWSC